ncbi:MAG: gamma-glutamyl-gamma-aminobutyrate hydrolase family protein [Actinomycetota bacterium]|nr:gamma-glutamyl-gamma-aminobutyrate hydrolase family protein [Actinomycetota bacterium]
MLRPRIAVTSCAPATGPHAEVVGREYVDAVLEAGGLPVVLPILTPDLAAEALAGCHGLLLTGGGDVDPTRYGAEAHPEVYGVDPRRDAWELALLSATDLPVLGICRGSQLINVAAGGTLVQHLPDHTDVVHRDRERDREYVHEVDVTPVSRLHAVLGHRRVGVNSLHHQAVDRVGAGLQVVATATDGTIEAVESTGDRQVLAVQWHPELLAEREPHRSLFTWLIAAADAHRTHDSAGLGVSDAGGWVQNAACADLPVN